METPNERSEFCVCIFSPCLIAFTHDSDSLESEGDEDRWMCVLIEDDEFDEISSFFFCNMLYLEQISSPSE